MLEIVFGGVVIYVVILSLMTLDKEEISPLSVFGTMLAGVFWGVIVGSCSVIGLSTVFTESEQETVNLISWRSTLPSEGDLFLGVGSIKAESIKYIFVYEKNGRIFTEKIDASHLDIFRSQQVSSPKAKIIWDVSRWKFFGKRLVRFPKQVTFYLPPEEVPKKENFGN